MSSSRSAETSSVAIPASRASRSRPQMSACAPTSTPRVGWAATSSRGPPSISRPTTSFCWFPPDSAAAVVSGPGARTSKRSMTWVVLSRAAPGSMSQRPPKGAEDWWPSMRFSHSGAWSSSA